MIQILHGYGLSDQYDRLRQIMKPFENAAMTGCSSALFRLIEVPTIFIPPSSVCQFCIATVLPCLYTAWMVAQMVGPIIIISFCGEN